MNWALIVYRNGDHCGVCEGVFMYRTDAKYFAEHVYINENIHTAVVELGTGTIICEFET